MARMRSHTLSVFSKGFSRRCLAAICLALVPPSYCADWLTDGGDSRRNNWQKDERILTPANVSGLHLLWKARLDKQQRQMHSLLEPLVIGSVTTGNGPLELVI